MVGPKRDSIAMGKVFNEGDFKCVVHSPTGGCRPSLKSRVYAETEYKERKMLQWPEDGVTELCLVSSSFMEHAKVPFSEDDPIASRRAVRSDERPRGIALPT